IQNPRKICISGLYLPFATDVYAGMNVSGSTYLSVVTSTDAAVPKDTLAISGAIAPLPTVSHALSAPVAISGRPSLIPVSALHCAVIVPIVSPGSTSLHILSTGQPKIQ